MSKSYLHTIIAAAALCSLSAGAAEYILPFTFEATRANLDKCVVVDVNDDASGEYGKWYFYNNAFCYQCNDDSDNKADDWLFLPMVDFGGATEVTVSFAVKTERYPEAFEVYLGKSQEQSAMTVAVANESGFVSRDAYTPFSVNVTIPSGESTEWCLGFHAVSEPYMFNIYINDIKVESAGGGQVVTVIPAAPTIKESAMDYLNYTATVVMPLKGTEGADITDPMTLNVSVDGNLADSYQNLTAGEEKEVSLTLTPGGHTISFQAERDGIAGESVSEDVTAVKKVIVPGVPTVGEGTVTGMSYAVKVTMPTDDAAGAPISEMMSLKVEENEVVIKTVSDLAAGATVDLDLSLGAGVHTLSFYAVIDGANGEAVEKEVTINEPTYTLPFTFEPSLETVKECVVIDGNGDGNAAGEGVWSISEEAFCYKYSDKNNADDWVILPFVEVGETRNITVSVSVKTGGTSYNEAFELKLGNSRTVNGMTQSVLARNDFNTNKEYVTLTAEVVLPDSDSDKWALGIHAISPSDEYMLWFKDIEIYATPTEEEIPASPELIEGSLADNIYTATIKMPTETAAGAAIDESAKMTLKVTVDNEVASSKENLAPGEETEVTLTLDAGRHVVLFSAVLNNAESEAEREIVTVKNSAVTTGNLPYTFTVTQGSFDNCIFVDVNSDGEESYGKGMWTYQYRYDNGGGAFKYFAGSADADDWIILPMVDFGEAKAVAVSLDVETESDPEAFEVYLGKSRTVEAMTLEVMKYSDYTHQGTYGTVSASVDLPQGESSSNEWCLGIRAVSPADSYVMYINNIRIKQDSTTAIGAIEAGEEGAEEYYDLQGMRIDSPAAGRIVIVRKGSKTYKKMM